MSGSTTGKRQGPRAWLVQGTLNNGKGPQNGRNPEHAHGRAERTAHTAGGLSDTVREWDFIFLDHGKSLKSSEDEKLDTLNYLL